MYPTGLAPFEVGRLNRGLFLNTGMHVHQRFHAVGHGTFMTGFAKPSRHAPCFSWVYDCGSKRRSLLNDPGTFLASRVMRESPIDMLVLSHFDDDHVSGLEELLKQRSTRWLVLPFSEWHRRLRDVSIGGAKGVSASTALLQLDPAGWLASRDLTQQVGGLLLVQGGRPDPDASPLDIGTLPDGPLRDPGDNRMQNLRMVSALPSSELAMGSAKRSGSMAAHVMLHQRPVLAGTQPLEFMFYNAEIPGTDLSIIDIDAGGSAVSKKSRMHLPAVRHDVDTTIAALGLDGPISKLPAGWRAELKACYQRHFGTTNSAKNNISLCLYVRPLLRNQIVEPCTIYMSELRDRHLSDQRISIDSFDFSRPAVLCTGDLRLDPTVIADMQSHFGIGRWDQIGVTQVPHHGSEHSWVSGNANLLAPSVFVHCAPGSPAHPHARVKADLSNSSVFTADYERSVTFDYHLW